MAIESDKDTGRYAVAGRGTRLNADRGRRRTGATTGASARPAARTATALTTVAIRASGADDGGPATPTEIWTGQFNIVSGNTQEDGPYVGVFEGSQGAAGIGVYVVAEPVGGATAQLCNEVIDTIAMAFGTPEAALTNNLSRALTAGHQHVQRWNQLRGRDRLAAVGISCLAVRGDEAYLAQSGPALVVAHTGGRFRVSQPTGDDSRRPLGLGERVAPVYTRYSLVAGDVVLMVFARTEQLVDHGTLLSLAAAPPEEALPALYVRAREETQFGALYAAVVPAAQPDPPPTRAQSGRAPSGEAGRRESPPSGRHRAQTEAPASPTAPRRAAAPTWQSVARRALAALTRQTRAQSLGMLGAGSRLPMGRMLAVSAGALALVFTLWLAIPPLMQHGNEDRYVALVRGVDTTLAASLQEPDAQKRRALLTRADTDLQEARALRATGPELPDRQARLDAALAQIDGVRDLAGLTQAADLNAAGVAPQSAVELVAVGGRAYLLDVAAGKVLAFGSQPSGSAEAAFVEGRNLGGETTGKARHITLAPAVQGRPAMLLVLDSNRRLFGLSNDGQWRSVPLRGADAWKSDTAIAGAAGGLFVLDTGADQIWRHPRGEAGFDAAPEPLLGRTSLKDAAGLSVIGVPVLATGNSRLVRINEGREEEFKPSGLDRALVGPSAPIFNPTDGLIYIADRGNQRIVTLEANGAFHTQFVSRRLNGLRALALDEATGAIYVVSGQTLLVAPVPR